MSELTIEIDTKPINTAILNTEIISSIGGTSECSFRRVRNKIVLRVSTSNTLTQSNLIILVENHFYVNPPATPPRDKKAEYQDTANLTEKVDLLAKDLGFK